MISIIIDTDYLLFIQYYEFPSKQQRDEEQDFKLTDLETYVGNFLMKMIMTAHFNGHLVFFDQSKLFFTSGGCTTFDECEIGFGIFPLISYFNHSCDANAMTYDVKDKVVVYATHQIMPGEQVS